MSRKLARILLLLCVLPLLLGAKSRTMQTPGEFRKKAREASSRKAWKRAEERLHKIRVGMTTAEFFQVVGIHIFYDRPSGLHDLMVKPVGAYTEGHLPRESWELSQSRKPDSCLVFGYYEDPKTKVGAVEKLRVVFHDDVLHAIERLDDETGDGALSRRASEALPCLEHVIDEPN